VQDALQQLLGSVIEVVPDPPDHDQAELAHPLLALLLPQYDISDRLPGPQQFVVLDLAVELTHHAVVTPQEIRASHKSALRIEEPDLQFRVRQLGAVQKNPADRFAG